MIRFRRACAASVAKPQQGLPFRSSAAPPQRRGPSPHAAESATSVVFRSVPFSAPSSPLNCSSTSVVAQARHVAADGTARARRPSSRHAPAVLARERRGLPSGTLRVPEEPDDEAHHRSRSTARPHSPSARGCAVRDREVTTTATTTSRSPARPRPAARWSSSRCRTTTAFPTRASRSPRGASGSSSTRRSGRRRRRATGAIRHRGRWRLIEERERNRRRAEGRLGAGAPA